MVAKLPKLKLKHQTKKTRVASSLIDECVKQIQAIPNYEMLKAECLNQLTDDVACYVATAVRDGIAVDVDSQECVISILVRCFPELATEEKQTLIKQMLQHSLTNGLIKPNPSLLQRFLSLVGISF